MHSRFIVWGLVALAVGAGWAIGAGLAAAAEKSPMPNVFGSGIPLTFSGLDGRTTWAEPMAATVMADGLALKFRLPKDPILRLKFPGAAMPALRWRLVSNDILAADIPGDTLPLVIGFSTENTLVGRLPAGWSVTLEAGDTSVVLLRRSLGDRSQFAFAWSARGAKEAAVAAGLGLKISIESLFEAREDFFKRLPGPPPDPQEVRTRAMVKAFSVMKANVWAPEDPIGMRWTTPARWPLRDMFLAESAYQSLGLMHYDVGLARDALQAVYRFQDAAGFIPGRMTPAGVSETSHPPILAWAAWQVYAFDRMRDRPFLEKSFDAAQKHVVWYMKTRRLDGGPPPEKPLEYGTPLYAWKSPEESGAENSPRFEGGSQFAAIDLSCYLANECWTLQAMAQQLGFRELAKTWGVRGDAIADAARKHLWRADRGFFYDRKTADGEWIDVTTSAGLLALWSGVATAEQTAKIKTQLLDPKKFWTASPLPTVARDDPKYQKDMWCGPSWVTVNYLMIRGLQRAGMDREAKELAEKTLTGVASWYERTGCLYEFYDSDGTDAPVTLDRKGWKTSGSGYLTISDYNPTAALYVDLLLRAK